MPDTKGIFAALAAASVLAACGGGGFSGASVAASPQGTTAPASTLVPLNGTAGSQQSVVLPSSGGYSGTMLLTLAGTASGASANVSVGESPPPGVPVPPGADQPLVYVGLAVSTNVALAGIPGFIFSVPASALQSVRRSSQSGNFAILLNVFDPAAPSAGFQSGETCSVSGQTVTCTGGSVQFNLVAQLQYVFELAQRNLTPAPTPSAAAGGTATITVPTPAPIVCSPSSDIVGVNQTNIIACTAQGYGGTFKVAVADPTIVSVALADSSTFDFFNVTGLKAGSTTLTFQSQPGGTGSIAITVEP